MPGHDCITASYMKWKAVENGKLLQLAAKHHFDAFITTDRGLEYEQNKGNLPLAVIVLMGKDNKLKTIESLVPLLLRALNSLKPKTLVKVEQ